MIIYKATNLCNGKFYIGKFQGEIEKRIYHHFWMAKNPTTYFHRALNKYGRGSFKWEVIATTKNPDELIQLEIKFIEELNPQYNMTKGGEGISGFKHSEETKRKMSESISKAMIGKKYPNRKSPPPMPQHVRDKLRATSIAARARKKW